MRIFALARDADLDGSTQRPPIHVVLRNARVHRELEVGDYVALRQLCGSPQRGAPPAEDTERVRQLLVADGLLEAATLTPGFEQLRVDHRVEVAAGVEPEPVLYEIVQSAQRLGYVSRFDAWLWQHADGRHDAHALASVAASAGSETSPQDIADALERLRAIGLVDGAVRKPGFTVQPEAYVVHAPATPRYVLGADEAAVLARCRGNRTLSEVMAECNITAEPDREWLRRVVAKAAAIGVVTVSPDPRIAARATPARGAPVRPTPQPPVLPSRPTPPQLSAAQRAAFAEPPEATAIDADGLDANTAIEVGDAGRSLEEVTPSGAAELVSPGRASYPQMRADPTPVPRTAHPARPSAPIAVATMPLSMHAARPSTPLPIAADPGIETKLASLAGLSLDKDNLKTARANTGHGAARVQKLPWILLALVTVGGGFYHFKTVRDLKARPAVTQTAEPTTPTAAPISRHALLASGYIAAKAPIVLSATSSGRVEEIKVDNGDQIKKGQLLVVVNDGPIRAELSLANARVRDAKRVLQRTRMLVKAQAATPVELERATGAVEIAAAEARVIAQKLQETRIKSPIDGTVLEVLVRPGETITAGANSTGVLRIADLTALIAEVNVGEAELKQVFLGQECEVTSEAQRDAVSAGVVREIAEQADRARGTVLVKVDIEATAAPSLKPGMAVQVRFKPPAAAPDQGPAPSSSSAPTTNK